MIIARDRAHRGFVSRPGVMSHRVRAGERLHRRCGWSYFDDPSLGHGVEYGQCDVVSFVELGGVGMVAATWMRSLVPPTVHAAARSGDRHLLRAPNGLRAIDVVPVPVSQLTNCPVQNVLPVMRTPYATRSRSSSVTTSELAAVQRLWSIAGLPPTSGYGSVILALLLASARQFVDLVSSIDFDDAAAVADAVDAMLCWRDDAEREFFAGRAGSWR